MHLSPPGSNFLQASRPLCPSESTEKNELGRLYAAPPVEAGRALKKEVRLIRAWGFVKAAEESRVCAGVGNLHKETMAPALQAGMGECPKSQST